MAPELQKTIRYNFSVNITDGGFFGFAQGLASFVTIIPLFVSNLTDSALLIALIPAIHTLGWQLPQLLTVQHVARLRRYLPFVLMMTLHERVPYLGLALIALLLPHLGNSWALALTFLLLIWQGLGGGFTATAWQSMIAKIMPAQRRGLFFGTQMGVASLGGAVAAALGGWLLERLDYSINFAVAFGVASVAMGISWAFLAATREAPHEPEPLPDERASDFVRRLPALLRGDPNFVWFLLCRWLVQVGFIGSAFYSVFAVRRHGVGELEIGVYTSVMLVTQMVMGPVVGWLGDRWGHRLVMGGGSVALALSALLSWFAPSGSWFGLVFLLLGIGNASYWTPGIAMVLDFAPARERQTYIGLANTLMAPAAILAPLFGGWLADAASYEAAFLVSTVGAALTAFLLIFVVHNPRRESASSPASQPAWEGEGLASS